MTHQPEAVAGLFQGAAIQAIRTRIAKHRRVLGAAKRALPGFLADHCVDCVVKPEQLILYVDSPAWASQIRFYALHLLTRLEQSTGHRFNDLQIRNALPTGTKPLGKPASVSAPAFVAELLKSSASSTTSREIKEALLRLSETVQAFGKSASEQENR